MLLASRPPLLRVCSVCSYNSRDAVRPRLPLGVLDAALLVLSFLLLCAAASTTSIPEDDEEILGDCVLAPWLRNEPLVAPVSLLRFGNSCIGGIFVDSLAAAVLMISYQ